MLRSDRNFFDLSPSLMCVANFEGRFIDVNDSWVRTLGWSKEELCSMPYVRFVHPEDRPVTDEKSGDLLGGKTVVKFQNRYIAKDGSYRHLSWSANVSHEQKLIFAIAEDVTDQKIQEHQLNSLVASLEDIVLEIDTKGIFLNLWSPDSTLFSQPKAAVIGKNVRDVFSTSIADLFFKSLELVLSKDCSSFFVFHLVNKKVNWHRAKMSPIREKNKIKGVLVAIEDITEATESKQLLENLVQNIPAIVYRCKYNSNWTMLYISPSIERITGYKASDFINDSIRSFSSIIHPNDRKQIEQLVEAGIRENRAFDLTYRIIDSKGEIRWFSERGRAVFSDSNQFLYFDGALFDITDQKIAADRLMQTAKLSALGEMSAGIAHEINNPIAIIDGMAKVLREKSRRKILGENELDEELSALIATTQRISQIVSSLRIFSRDSSNDQLVETDLQTVLSSTLKLCKERFNNRDIYPPTIPEMPAIIIHCQPVQITQVFLNLFNNAIDAVEGVPDPVVKLEIQVNEAFVEAKVIDNGPGIAPALADKIFQPFFTTKEVGKGTGLGLSISRGIVESHQGELYLDKRTQETTFVVKIPLATP